MTATLSPTFAPPSALLIWADERSIYVQYPRSNPTSPPKNVTNPKTERGQSKALANQRTTDNAGHQSIAPAKPPQTLAERILHAKCV